MNCETVEFFFGIVTTLILAGALVFRLFKYAS
jgi:hypothetical protein